MNVDSRSEDSQKDDVKSNDSKNNDYESDDPQSDDSRTNDPMKNDSLKIDSMKSDFGNVENARCDLSEAQRRNVDEAATSMTAHSWADPGGEEALDLVLRPTLDDISVHLDELLRTLKNKTDKQHCDQDAGGTDPDSSVAEMSNDLIMKKPWRTSPDNETVRHDKATCATERNERQRIREAPHEIQIPNKTITNKRITDKKTKKIVDRKTIDENVAQISRTLTRQSRKTGEKTDLPRGVADEGPADDYQKLITRDSLNAYVRDEMPNDMEMNVRGASASGSTEA